MAREYKKRIADILLGKKLASKGAVLIVGPKWCGKTTTAEQVAKSVLYMADPDSLEQNLQMAGINTKALLNGETPRLIDEWQVAPKLWDAVRFAVDHREGFGHFILTGSAVPPDTGKIMHSGTGRISRLLMRTMSLWESGESSGEVSLRTLFENPLQIEGYNCHDLSGMAYLACRGGWPDATSLEGEAALSQAFDYLDAIVNTDIGRVDGVARDAGRAKGLMRSFARHLGTQITLRALRNDMLVNDVDTLSEDTIRSYVNALKRIFVIEDMPAWNPNLRSKAAIRTSDNRYFVDPSIAVAALGAGPDDMINDLNTFGFVFENLCVRDLRVYAGALDGEVYHYRDSNGLECDTVLHLRNGRYGLIEIKLGGEKLIEEGCAALTKMADTIDTSKMNKPAFKMVLTAVGNYAYRRRDGIYIVPIGCLKD